MKKVLKGAVSAIILLSTIVYLSPVYALTNSETVYSKLDSNGDRYKTIVTTKENEEVNQEDSEKDLPIETKVTYKLDGKDIDPEELAGKSGKVTIKIECENKSAKKVTINGREEIMYTPFVVALGTVIDSKNNKNIKVSDCGRIVENGDKTIVVGVVFPGLDKSLDLSGKLADIDVPDSIEITMEAANFELKNIFCYANPKILTEDIDWNDFDELFDSVNELKNGIDKIEDGANKLADGTNKLKDGTYDLANGTKTAYNGSSELKKQVENAIKALQNDNSKALDKKTLDTIGNEAGKKAKEQAVSNIKKQSETISNKAEEQAKKELGDKEKTKKVMSKIENYINSTMKSEDTQRSIAKKVGEAIQSKSEEIVKNAVMSGVKDIAQDLQTITSKVKADASVSTREVNVSVDYKTILNNNSKYDSLTEEEKEIVKAVVGEVTEKVETQAEKQANEEIKDITKEAEENAKNSATISAQKALGDVAQKAATKSATTAASDAVQNVSTTSVSVGVEEAFEQLKKQISQNASKMIEQYILPYVGQIANQTAESVAAEVAEATAKQTAITVADQVADEVKKAAIDSVKNQMKTLLNEGISPLNNGLKQINAGASKLYSGTNELNSGAKELADGIHKYNIEGITKISNFVSGDLRNLEIRAKKLEELSKEYNKFNSKDEREDINFISMIDSIKDEESNENKTEN